MQKYREKAISINGKRLRAIIADSEAKRMIGLMFRKSLGSGKCMLFVFPYEGFHGIWMYNMQFAIDVVWFDGKLCVVDIMEGFKPCKSFLGCKPYVPVAKAKYVAELNAGAVKKYKIRIGARLNRL